MKSKVNNLWKATGQRKVCNCQVRAKKKRFGLRKKNNTTKLEYEKEVVI